MPDRGISYSPSPRWRGAVRPRDGTKSPEARWRRGYEEDRTFSSAEVWRHHGEEDPWVSIGGSVYAVGQLAKVHPGGAEAILRHAGQDATEHFVQARHTRQSRDALSAYRLGLLLPRHENDLFNLPPISPSTAAVLATFVAVTAIVVGFLFAHFRA